MFVRISNCCGDRIIQRWNGRQLTWEACHYLISHTTVLNFMTGDLSIGALAHSATAGPLTPFPTLYAKNKKRGVLGDLSHVASCDA